MNETRIGRYWELDLLRGIAVLMMISFHALFDLDYFSGTADVHSGIWPLFAKATASIFLLLVGASLTISSARAKMRGEDTFIRYLKRGVRIFFWGMAVTLSTFLLLGDGYVVFGVLHLIGVSIILSYPLLRRPLSALVIGTAVVYAGLLLRQFSFGSPWLLWLGFVPGGFYSVDYFPLLPWFGVVAMGIFLGDVLYPGGVRLVALPDISAKAPARQICSVGRNSLSIYLIHQPILIISMQLLGIIEISNGLAFQVP